MDEDWRQYVVWVKVMIEATVEGRGTRGGEGWEWRGELPLHSPPARHKVKLLFIRQQLEHLLFTVNCRVLALFPWEMPLGDKIFWRFLGEE